MEKIFESLALLASQDNSPNNSHLNKILLIRRNGQRVPWNSEKIQLAVAKAFSSLKLSEDPSSSIAKKVTQKVNSWPSALIYIEEVQDLVETTLNECSFQSVAIAYADYRKYRSLHREKNAQNQGEGLKQTNFIWVQKTSGELSLWDHQKFENQLAFVQKDLSLLFPWNQILTAIEQILPNPIPEEKLNQSLIQALLDLIPTDPHFSKLAARLWIINLYETHLSWSTEEGTLALKEAHARAFEVWSSEGLKTKTLDPRVCDFSIQKLAEALDPEADFLWEFSNLYFFIEHYLKNPNTQTDNFGGLTALPQFFWMKIALGLHLNEGPQALETIIKTYNLLSHFRITFSPAILKNAATNHPFFMEAQVQSIEDSLTSIMSDGISGSAFFNKWGCSVGSSWTKVRGEGTGIASLNSQSQGIGPFLRLHDAQIDAIQFIPCDENENIAFLEAWHSDVEKFIELCEQKKDRLNKLHLGLWLPELFFKRLQAQQSWTLFHSNEVTDLIHLQGNEFEMRYMQYEKLAQEGKVFSKLLSAEFLWKKILSSLFENGAPYLGFKEAANLRSPRTEVEAAGLNTAIIAPTRDHKALSCFGSINLAQHVKAEVLIIDHIKESVEVLVRTLNNCIEIAHYPDEISQKSQKSFRRIAVGVEGLNEALLEQKIAFDSPEALAFNAKFSEQIAFLAYQSSCFLTETQGQFPAFKDTLWAQGVLPQDSHSAFLKSSKNNFSFSSSLDWASLRQEITSKGLRNDTFIAYPCLPSCSYLLNVSPSIQAPKTLLQLQKKAFKFWEIHPLLSQSLKEQKLWNEELFDQIRYFEGCLEDIETIPDFLKKLHRNAFQMDPHFCLEATFLRQFWIDQSQTLDFFLKMPSFELLNELYRKAFKLGLKTTRKLHTKGYFKLREKGTK